MKRFLTRHMSLRRRDHYTRLSCSDPQLHRERTLQDSATRDACVNEDTKPSTNISQRENVWKRRWHKLSRRKKRQESDSVFVHQTDVASGHHDDFEIGVEASPNHDIDVPTYSSHATLARSVSASMLDVRNNTVDVGHFAQAHHRTISMPLSVHIQGRRFAICEELEREIIMEDGVNLRKSRKNLVIRQVLHDLLLL